MTAALMFTFGASLLLLFALGTLTGNDKAGGYVVVSFFLILFTLLTLIAEVYPKHFALEMNHELLCIEKESSGDDSDETSLLDEQWRRDWATNEGGSAINLQSPLFLPPEIRRTARSTTGL